MFLSTRSSLAPCLVLNQCPAWYSTDAPPGTPRMPPQYSADAPSGTPLHHTLTVMHPPGDKDVTGFQFEAITSTSAISILVPVPGAHLQELLVGTTQE